MNTWRLTTAKLAVWKSGYNNVTIGQAKLHKGNLKHIKAFHVQCPITFIYIYLRIFRNVVSILPGIPSSVGIRIRTILN